jgi:hypothetical protein
MTKTHRQTLDGKKHPSFATQSARSGHHQNYRPVEIQ